MVYRSFARGEGPIKGFVLDGANLQDLRAPPVVRTIMERLDKLPPKQLLSMPGLAAKIGYATDYIRRWGATPCLNPYRAVFHKQVVWGSPATITTLNKELGYVTAEPDDHGPARKARKGR